MSGTFCFSSVSSRVRATFGRLRGAVARRNVVDELAEEDAAFKAGSSLNGEEFVSSEFENDKGEKTEIFVAKVSEPAYFDEDAEYVPTIVGSPKQEEVTEVPAEPVKKERFVAAEPADLFINALRRPVRPKVDTSAPVIKKKVVKEAVPEKTVATEETVVIPVIEKIEIEAESVSEPEIVTICDAVGSEASVITSVVEAPITEEAVLIPVTTSESESLNDTILSAFEADESKIECEIAHDAVVVEDAEPIEEVVSAPVVVPMLPRKIEIEPLEPAAESGILSASVEVLEAAETSTEAINTPVTSLPSLEVVQDIQVVDLADESEVLLAFRPELSEDRREFASTSYDDNYAFREDKLDETEMTFKIRRSSVFAPAYRFDGNLRSLR